MNSWIPFLHAMLLLLGVLILILLSLHSEQIKAQIERRRMKLLDKAHWAMSQSPKRSAV